jgi:rod shape-determining protein MreC
LLSRGSIAQVLARHFSSSNQFFLVDAGSSHGIKKDMVALYCNAIVGRVAEVYPWYCKVCLITDVDCKVAAVCLKKKASGIHEGINDESQSIMRYVSHLELVTIGDDVFSSGEGLVFPKGFALGKVVFADKGELFYAITIRPSLDFQTLRYCTLVAKEDI